MSILITGGTGVIGSNLARLLGTQGRSVVLYDVLPPPATGNIYAEVADKVKLEIGNVTDLPQILHVIQKHKVEGMIHCAAIQGNFANERPVETIQVNIMGCVNVLEAARIMGLKRVVTFSSAATMGQPEDINTPIKEDQYYLPLSGAYPLSKLTCEQLTNTYRSLYQTSALAVRLRGVYGPGEKRYPETGQPYRLLFAQALQGKPIRYETGGDTIIEITYVKDVARGVMLAYDCPDPKYHMYNLSFGQNRTVYQLRDALRKVFPGLSIDIGPGLWPGALARGRQVDLAFRPAQKPPLDITRASEEFGYKPEFDVEQGYTHWLRWVRDSKYG